MTDHLEVLQAREALRLIDSAHAVMADLFEQGVVRQIPTRPVSREVQNARIRELWDLNWSRVEIARELNLNRSTVTNRLQAMEARALPNPKGTTK